MNEFEMIERFFKPLTRGETAAAELCDDAAVLSVPEGYELVVSSDTLNEGVHFLKREAPEYIARKALAVNLSDLASMGAKPWCYQLNLAFAVPPCEAWLGDFSHALQDENVRFDIFCSGGDTTRLHGEGLSISITAMGLVPRGQAVRRGGAQEGDALVVTGYIGEAALGLRVLQKDGDEAFYARAIERYRMPAPRVGMEAVLQENVHAGADISDGLVADCVNIARASGLCVEINIDAVPVSEALNVAVSQGLIERDEVVTGGDDYELALAVPQKNLDVLMAALQSSGLRPAVIGRFVHGDEVFKIISSEDISFDTENTGWVHF